MANRTTETREIRWLPPNYSDMHYEKMLNDTYVVHLLSKPLPLDQTTLDDILVKIDYVHAAIQREGSRELQERLISLVDIHAYASSFGASDSGEEPSGSQDTNAEMA